MGVVFSGGPDSITCRAVVTWSLVGLPHIQLHSLNSTDGLSLTHDISNEATTDFTCTVCITVPESGIEDHCSNDTLSTSSSGECTSDYCSNSDHHSIPSCPHTEPGRITPVRTIDSDSHHKMTINWSSSHNITPDIVRYIVDVMEYYSTGDGQIGMKSVSDYPLQLPATVVHHTVGTLGTTGWGYLCHVTVYVSL